MILNIVLILAVALVFVYLVYRNIQKKKNAEVEKLVDVDDQTYTLQKMTDYIKKRLDEITKINPYFCPIILNMSKSYNKSYAYYQTNHRR